MYCQTVCVRSHQGQTHKYCNVFSLFLYDWFSVCFCLVGVLICLRLMCVHVEDISLGSERASRVEERAAERGHGVALQPSLGLCSSTHLPPAWAASHSHHPGYCGLNM